MYGKVHTSLIVVAFIALQVLAPYVHCQRSIHRPVIRAPRDAPTTGRYIVVLKGSVSKEDLQEAVAQVLDVSEDGGQVYEKIENVLTAKFSAEALETVRKIHQVHYIEEEDLAEGTEVVDIPWYLDRLDQVYLPLDQSYNPQGSGEGTDVYVLDTGINYDHYEFEYRAKYAGYDPVDQSLRAIEGYIPMQGFDCHGHGTHVASLCGGKTYGVAKKVSLYSVRVLGCDNRAPWGIILDGLNYVATVVPQRGRRAVVMMTFSGSHHQSVSDAIATLHGLGIPVIVSAGNRQSDACLYSPASSPRTITVGATDITDAFYNQNNYGACVDLFAPGDSLLAAGYNCSTCTAVKSGTSQATALVAGVAALYLEGLPLLTPDQLKEKLTQQAVDAIVGFDVIPENFINLTPNKLINLGIITECGGNLYTTDTSVDIHSPHYPMNYPNNLKCIWTITSKKDQQVEIKFNYIKLEKEYDTITICDGKDCNQTNIIAELSGRIGKTGCSYTSSGQALTLVMLTDSTLAAPGFSASFTAATEPRLSNERKFLRSCNFPDTTSIQFDLQSAGWSFGNHFSMMKDWEEIFGGRLRGMNVAMLKESTGEVVLAKNFDTFASEENSNRLAATIEHAAPGRIVLVAVSDEATNALNERARRALRALGSQKIHKLDYQGSWAMVGIKGISPGKAIEHFDNSAPAEISMQYKLQASEKLGIQITAKSAGFSVGNLAEISIGGEVITISPEGYNRGLNVIIINEKTGAVLHKEVFDTAATVYTGTAPADAFTSLIHSLPSGRIVAIAVKEDAVEALTESAKEACESIGSTLIRQIQHRGSWAFIGRKGGDSGSVAEVGSNTAPVESTFWLAVDASDSVETCNIAVSSRGLSTDIAVKEESVDDRQRGITVIALEEAACTIDESSTFDTHGSTSQSDALAAFITKIPSGRIVAATVSDEASNQLTEKAKLALESIGSLLIRRLSYRGAWAIVGRKGAAPGSVPEVINPKAAALAAVRRLHDRNVTSVMVQSAGYRVGNFYKILVNEQIISMSCGYCRGLNVMTLDESSGNVVHKNSYDTYASFSSSEAFATFINSLPDGTIVAIAVKDECTNRLTESAKRAIEGLGSNLIRQIQYHGSWALVSKKGDDQSIVEAGSNSAAVQVSSWVPKPPTPSSDCIIAVHSSGYGKGLSTQITVNGIKTQSGYGRGITVAIVDQSTCIVETSTTFDTHVYSAHADDLAALIRETSTGRIVVATVWDTANSALTENAKLALESIGSAQIRNLGFQEAWAIIGKKGLPPGSVPEVLHPSSASLETRVRLSETCEDDIYKLNCLAAKESSILV